MKKLLVLVIAVVSSLTAMGQQYAACVNGYWTDWEGGLGSVTFQETNNGFILYQSTGKPWDFSFRCTMDMQSSYKEDKWTVYSGTAEYYTSKDYPTIASMFSSYHYPFVYPCYFYPDARKHTVRAQIKIRKNIFGKTYNIWFDNVGFGVSL